MPVGFEDALLYTASLLDSASATALDCGELLDSLGWAKILAVWHLLEIAKTTVDRSL
uniref:hypothetical protein n=1 Tax=Pseudomonas lactis TaxID=1615674 RepID=UPI0012961537|nr:hypothetical protein [Pseudomonas lactis]